MLIALAAGWDLPRISTLAYLALAMGLQNGLSTVVSGALLRNSHLTGMFTDVAVAVGQSFSGRPWDRRRVGRKSPWCGQREITSTLATVTA